MSFAQNLKYIRKEVEKRSQPAFADLINKKSKAFYDRETFFNKGNIDSYERGVANPPLDLLRTVARQYKITIETLTNTDLKANPHLIYSGDDDNNNDRLPCEDLLRAKDEIIGELKRQNAFLQKTIDKLTNK